MSRKDIERWLNCVAVYVRMSTEHQQYSTSNQMDVLREFATRIKKSIRGIDLACRLGGEEFVIVMPETDMAVATIMAERLRRRIADINATDPSRVTLIGHSRGGLLAKVLGQRRPNDIEQVIALGSPLADQSDITPLTQAAVGVVRTANEIGFGVKLRAEGRFAYDLRQPPAVPTTSIYTRSDDVVNFRSCIRPDIPSIAVWGSHNGLVINPEVYRLLGRLLARPRRAPAEGPARATAR